MVAGGDTKRSLSRFINVPGGITLAEAQERVSARLESLRGRVMSEMDEALTNIGAYLGLLREAPSEAVRGELHRLACIVVSLGGAFDRDGLSKAAYSFCILLDEAGVSGNWSRAAAEVHVNAMRALFSPAHIAPETQAHLLAGLGSVRRKAKSG